MSIPTIYFFIDSPKITIKAELKNEQIKVKALKGSPGKKESDRIMASLPSAQGWRKHTTITTMLFTNIMKLVRLLKT